MLIEIDGHGKIDHRLFCFVLFCFVLFCFSVIKFMNHNYNIFIVYYDVITIIFLYDCYNIIRVSSMQASCTTLVSVSQFGKCFALAFKTVHIQSCEAKMVFLCKRTDNEFDLSSSEFNKSNTRVNHAKLKNVQLLLLKPTLSTYF